MVLLFGEYWLRDGPRIEEFLREERIAYFSMEIVLRVEIATYSGGLGVLAGDTMRSAADLNLPLRRGEPRKPRGIPSSGHRCVRSPGRERGSLGSCGLGDSDGCQSGGRHRGS